ncbi:MAG: ABC transporter permease [Limnochordia bacterium]|jgi:lipoprotein-releasing system permease protein
MPFFLHAALRYIFARPKSSLVAITGIVAAVAALLVVLGITNGLHAHLLEQLLGLEPHLELLAGIDYPLSDYGSVVEEVAGVPHVREVTPYVQGQVLIGREGTAPQGIYIRGIDEPYAVFAPYVDGWGEGLLMGGKLADSLGVEKGGRVFLVGARGQRTVTVAGLFSTGMDQYDRRLAYLPLEWGQGLLGYGPDEVTGLAVWLDDPLRAGEAAAALQERTGLWVRSWQEKQKNLLAVAAVERQAMIAILLVTFVVAGIGVANVLWLNVWEKRRDIAVLQAIGARRPLLFGIFFSQGLMLGLFGLIGGTALGLGTLYWLRGKPISIPELTRVQYIPVLIESRDLLLAAGLALTISALAGLTVLWQVGRRSIAREVHYE